eukprot:TRINITY_DN4815_c0_g2_i1.p1 TRINITY_DN4815_c0_g2~~TRINITY_DN4815_c0_g2_i1.p1  ORF type:complete len:289 (-),score=-4.91 TRINITY_DN4815_c0_g2_i1:198-1064(-)
MAVIDQGTASFLQTLQSVIRSNATYATKVKSLEGLLLRNGVPKLRESDITIDETLGGAAGAQVHKAHLKNGKAIALVRPTVPTRWCRCCARRRCAATFRRPLWSRSWGWCTPTRAARLMSGVSRCSTARWTSLLPRATSHGRAFPTSQPSAPAAAPCAASCRLRRRLLCLTCERRGDQMRPVVPTLFNYFSSNRPMSSRSARLGLPRFLVLQGYVFWVFCSGCCEGSCSSGACYPGHRNRCHCRHQKIVVVPIVWLGVDKLPLLAVRKRSVHRRRCRVFLLKSWLFEC